MSFNPANTYVLMYNKYSKGGRALAKELGVKPVSLHGIGAVAHSAVLINWGCSAKAIESHITNGKLINKPTAVGKAGNKLKLFNILDGKVRIPEFTENVETALEWLEQGHEVLGRRTNSSGGADIAFFSENPDVFSSSQFWTKYKKKKNEFRVHIMDGAVLFVQKKVLRVKDEAGNPIDKKDADFRIRNLANGFIFQKYNFSVPDDVIKQATEAMALSGLDFGAVDVIFNEYEGKAYVLEINTAPGLEGTSPQDYANAIKEMVA